MQIDYFCAKRVNGVAIIEWAIIATWLRPRLAGDEKRLCNFLRLPAELNFLSPRSQFIGSLSVASSAKSTEWNKNFCDLHFFAQRLVRFHQSRKSYYLFTCTYWADSHFGPRADKSSMNKSSGNEIQKTHLAENAGKGNVEFNKNVFMEMILLEIHSIACLPHKHFRYATIWCLQWGEKLWMQTASRRRIIIHNQAGSIISETVNRWL